ncbi:MAG: response regulator [Candidatus Omnitrophica bacterium]|nr:response regulator [Candidatus Omnitrophota bacterium]
MNIRAFVFDEDPQIRSLLERVLREQGYEVFTFSNPSLCPLYETHQCICPLNHACSDIVITDLKMPMISGLDFVKSQKDKGCKIQNVALMSSSWSGEDAKTAEQLGCRLFTKPFSLAEIKAWLRDCEKRTDPHRELADWWIKKTTCNQETTTS